ncbi:ybeY [Symbiodinium microadriaticum]|nr:ybeY [Symbiodinium microadriaticum]
MDSIQIQIPSLAENIRIIESFIDNAKDRFQLDDDIYGNIMIAVTESVNNAILHGNKEAKNKNVSIHLAMEDNAIRFKVADEGEGFDFQNLPVLIHFEDVEPIAFNDTSLDSWLNQVAMAEGFTISALNIIFCSDEYLLHINQEYLNHDYYTDVITFSYSEDDKVLEGDVFISLDRIKENAEQFQQSVSDEICRVIVHGQLHLMGYNDHTEQDKTLMKEKEDASLSLRQ